MTPKPPTRWRPPSWRTAASETDASLRQLQQAQISLERAREEFSRLRDEGQHMARLELARHLIDGADGGVLSLLVAAAESTDEAAQRPTAVVLERLTKVLGLESLGLRGELLLLDAGQLGEFEVRGGMSAGSALYRVVRSGWVLGSAVVARPIVECVE